MGVPGHAANRLHEVDPEATADLLDVLGDLSVWRLAPTRWERVGRVLDEITAALAAMDLGMLRAATAELELTSPVRVHRIGAMELLPTPERIRDRANHLVHVLRTGEAPTAPDSVDPPDPGGGEGGERHTD